LKTDPKIDAFIKYCNANMKENIFRQREYENKKDIKNGIYNYYKTKINRYLIQIDFIYFNYKNIIYSIGFQYEDETCKITCMRPGKEYWSSKPEEIYDFIDIFRDNTPESYRLNLPRTKAFVSRSIKYKGITEKSDEEFSNIVFKEMLKAKDIIEQLIYIFKKKGCIFL
jgi:hypothetical protein